ncbi:plasmid pRiA4b ORF-3 family protein [Mesorhizobium carmichaelinearum]|uniref:plasmid pRiA4b ORF-3 family protein n=1 Tax=Mesorhizobium carmichaelinearum TaxID=1208188 RepID=UPI000BA439F8|nr:plasmid pRiA4b ORF-3 family protein [Mesorhizobium carmichaelinearum]
MTLYALHRTIQIAFGWENYHLHALKLHGRHYGTTRTGERHSDAAGREVMHADLQLRVRQRIHCEYDFGDLWEHEIRVGAKLKREGGKAYPVFIAGARAGPPEDYWWPERL